MNTRICLSDVNEVRSISVLNLTSALLVEKERQLCFAHAHLHTAVTIHNLEEVINILTNKKHTTFCKIIPREAEIYEGEKQKVTSNCIRVRILHQ